MAVLDLRDGVSTARECRPTAGTCLEVHQVVLSRGLPSIGGNTQRRSLPGLTPNQQQVVDSPPFFRWRAGT
jgi:hypothetical protein